MLHSLIWAECYQNGYPAMGSQDRDSNADLQFLLHFSKELGYVANLLPRDTEVVAVSSTSFPNGKGITVSMVGDIDADRKETVLAAIANPDDISRKNLNKFKFSKMVPTFGRKNEPPPQDDVPPLQSKNEPPPQGNVPPQSHTTVEVVRGGNSCWNEIKAQSPQETVSMP
jgi:hypothetical protein